MTNSKVPAENTENKIANIADEYLPLMDGIGPVAALNQLQNISLEEYIFIPIAPAAYPCR